jgi:hypothetical protein
MPPPAFPSFMTRSLLLACFLCTTALAARADAAADAQDKLPSPPVDLSHLPWKDGETLTYVVSCYGLLAAQGVFSAHEKPDHWQFNLDLKSLSWVNTFYPFTAQFWCISGPGNPWRSVEFGEYRFEPKRTIKERTRVDYPAHAATRENWVNGKTKTYPIAEAAVDDVGTMLYHLRTGPWKVGDRRTIFVYESDSEKESNATCTAIETKAFGTWPAQSLIKLNILPGKGTHHHGYLTMWLTNDARRVPIHAEIAFKYGTFEVDLTSMDKVSSP